MVTETNLFRLLLEMTGAREHGVRATVLVPDRAGQLAKLDPDDRGARQHRAGIPVLAAATAGMQGHRPAGRCACECVTLPFEAVC